MNLLADEGVDWPIVERLRRDGHDVMYVAEMSPGIDDNAVLAQANRRNALLLTLDKDFGELVYRQGLVHSGVILIRLGGLQPSIKADLVAAVLRERSTELRSAFTVIAPGSVRIRRKRADTER